MVVQISKPGVGRKAYWLDATIHAREWISTATAVKIINHVITTNTSATVSFN